MRTAMIALAAMCLFKNSAGGQGFVNLDFESGRVVAPDPEFGLLAWNTAVPGWSHGNGSDTQIVYWNHTHAGETQAYLLCAPGTVTPSMAGSLSMALFNGIYSYTGDSTWTQAFISQTGQLGNNLKSIQFLATGPFAVFIDGTQIPVQPLGENAFSGDISAFAGRAVDLKIMNTSPAFIKTPVVVDNIQFSTQPVPEPRAVFLVSTLALAWTVTRRRRP
jgi:hypothetical protein